MNFNAVILAGGKSSRMGRDKALLEIDGQTLLARQIKLAREVGACEVFISGRQEKNYSDFGCRVLVDRFPGAGPLAGIEKALSTVATPLLLVLAVDMPNLTPGILRQLRRTCAENMGAIPRVNDRIEPLTTFYPKAAAPLAANCLEEGMRAATHFAEACAKNGLAAFVSLTDCSAMLFENWNTPENVV